MNARASRYRRVATRYRDGDETASAGAPISEERRSRARPLVAGAGGRKRSGATLSLSLSASTSSAHKGALCHLPSRTRRKNATPGLESFRERVVSPLPRALSKSSSPLPPASARATGKEISPGIARETRIRWIHTYEICVASAILRSAGPRSLFLSRRRRSLSFKFTRDGAPVSRDIPY